MDEPGHDINYDRDLAKRVCYRNRFTAETPYLMLSLFIGR